MILPLLGLGAIALIAMGLSQSGAPRASTPTPGPAPAGTLPSPTEAAQHVREGNPTSEDYEALAREAERQGVPDTAEQLRERATEVPTRREVQTATPLPAEDSSALDSPRPTQVDDDEESEAVADPSQPDPETDQIPAPSPEAAEPEEGPTDPATDPNNPAPGFTPPAGFDPATARSLAASVASNIQSRQYSYSRNDLRAFQRAAGISADGIYGRESRGALAFYGVQNPPRPLFGSASDMAYPEALAYHAERMESGAAGSLFAPPSFVDSERAWVGFESTASDSEIAELLNDAGYVEAGREYVVTGNKKRRRRILGAIFGGPIGAMAALRARRRARRRRGK